MDITVVVLTYNEEIHIGRCIEYAKVFAKEVIIVDSFSTDRTVEVAQRYGVTVVQHVWPGNQAQQFNWALETIEFHTGWILRLDADEYLLKELVEEFREKLPSLSADITGVILKRRHIFLDEWMRRGTYPVKLLRLFRVGKGVYEERLMDEHILLLEGRAVEFENDFVDHNLNDLSFFCHKHVDYSIREALQLLTIEYGLAKERKTQCFSNEQMLRKRSWKYKYASSPLFVRSFFYFLYRYFYKGAFLEGKRGFIWTFLQGWWYRMLVDARIYEIKKACGNDKMRIKKFLLASPFYMDSKQ